MTGVGARVDPARVARVLGDLPVVRPQDPPYRLGSGYRISRRLVLTAAHVLEDVTAVGADLDGDGNYRPVTCVWRDEAADLALLRFDTAPATAVEPVRLGRLDRRLPTDMAALALGYPRYAAIPAEAGGSRDDGWRGRAAVPCSLRTGDTGAPGTLRVVLDAAPAPAPPGESPWEGMSGGAVFTRRSGLLVAVVRAHAASTGASTQEVTALDLVDDPGWRELLRAEGVDPWPVPALPDGWDGTGGSLEQHHVRLDAIRGAPEPLVPEKLPFVDPGDAGSPDNVLARLRELADSPGLPAGVVITGDPGAGKTRLCLETATRAADSPEWLVVHLTGHASLQSIRDSVERTRAERVLVVADNIDWITEPAEVYRRVCSEATGLAVLTTARFMRLKDLENPPLLASSTFEYVHVRSDPRYHASISREMVRSLAQNAVREAGEPEVRRLCEGPPEISRFYAQYWDRQAVEGGDLAQTRRPRPDAGFRVWVQSLLDEVGVPAVSWDADADPATTAVARIAAHSPCSLEKAGHFLDAVGGDPAGPHRMILRLGASGLLRYDRGEGHDTLYAAHDLYADVLLGHGVLEADGRSVHRAGLHRVLETGLADGDALVKVATSVDRLRETLDDEAGDRLARVVGAWCADHLGALRELVLEGPGSAGRGPSEGRELQVLLMRRTWRPMAVRELAEPWLRRYSTHPRARAAVSTAARHLPTEVGRPFLVGWIGHNRLRPEAAVAIHLAFGEGGIDPSAPEWPRTTEHAYEWLAVHGPQPNASYPLRRLLASRSGLPEGDPRVPQVLAWARRWLECYGTPHDSSFVARPLLARQELQGADLAWTARLLLETAASAPERASFALEAVLARGRMRGGLPKEVFSQAVTDSLAWLEDGAGHGLEPAAAYVLKELVRPVPGRDSLPRAVQAALNWLGPNADRRDELGLVLPPLLKYAVKADGRRNIRLTADEQEHLGALAARWLSSGADSPGRSVSEMLGAFLGTPLPDRDPVLLRRLANQALTLLEKRRDIELARSVLTPLLRKQNLDPDTRDRLLRTTFDQFPAALASRHTAYPLTSLVQRSDLSDEEYRWAMTTTLQWLDAHPGADGAWGLLTTALDRQRTTRAERGLLAARAVQMLSARVMTQPRKRSSPAEVLLKHRAEIRTEWNRFVARACDLLERAGHPDEAMRSLATMLKGTDQLEAPVLERLHTACLGWCAAHHRSGRSVNLLVPVLGIRAVPPRARRDATRMARDRLRPGSERNQDSGRLLLALLRDGHLPDADSADHVLEAALSWLDVHRTGDSGHFRPLMSQVTHRLDRAPRTAQRAERARRALGHLDAWLRGHPPEKAGHREEAEHLRGRLAALSGSDGDRVTGHGLPQTQTPR